MKAKILLISLTLTSVIALAQVSANLDTNNIRAAINANGDLFTGPANHSPAFEAPKGSFIHTMFTSTMWVAGLDVGGQLHISCQTYRQAGNDFWPGPLDTLNGSCSPVVFNSPTWNRVWKINKTTIDSFRQYLFNVPPPSIANWPGNGDPAYNQAKKLAPFFDVNGDDIYTPANGDYPLILGDQAVYFIYNDNGGIHTETRGLTMNLEIHGMAYAYNCNADSALNNNIFVDYRIINHGTTNFNNVYIGMFTDFDIGNASDDFVGSDVKRKMYFGYNGSPIDGNGGFGYGSNLPAQAVVFLKGVKADGGDGIDNNQNCIIDEPNETIDFSKFKKHFNAGGVQGNPFDSLAYYYNLRARWQNDSVLRYGGNGYNTGLPCSYQYPGSSDHQYEFGIGGTCLNPGPPQASWDEFTAGQFPSDVRGVGSMGPFSMAPGGIYTFHMAYVFGRDYTGGGPQASINVMNERVDSIRSYFTNGMTPCGASLLLSNKEEKMETTSINVFPNPANTSITISLPSLEKNAGFEMYDITGKLCLKGRLVKEQNQIDISKLEEGLYLLKINNGITNYSKKVIKL